MIQTRLRAPLHLFRGGPLPNILIPRFAAYAVPIGGVMAPALAVNLILAVTEAAAKLIDTRELGLPRQRNRSGFCNMSETSTLAEILKQSYEQLSPAEKRVCRALLADYPVAGLEPVNKLAERANVSAPTVLRLLSKLQVGSYPDMQKLLHGEIAARTSSPATMYKVGEGSFGKNDMVERSRRVIEEGVSATFEGLVMEDFEVIVDLLSEPKKRVWTTGGRFSCLLAEYLSMHLKHLRPNVSHVSTSAQARTFALLDIGPKDVVVAFDYRRYQKSTVAFLRQAKAQKATTILFTDPWLSPAAKHSDCLLSSAVTSASPFDSMSPGFALVETLIASLVEALGADPVTRLRHYDSTEPRLVDAEPDTA